MKKPGRNDPCPCGSGKKYKKCCLRQQQATPIDWQRLRQTERELVAACLEHSVEHYPHSLAEAWEEFAVDAEPPEDLTAHPEFEAFFLPWYIFLWVPDNEGLKPGELRYPDMPIARHYLETHRTELSDLQRRFIEEACRQPYSFFQVTALQPGHSLTLRDLMLRRTVTVLERTASRLLEKGHIVFARVITVDHISLLLGAAPTPLPPLMHSHVLDIRDHLEARWGRLDLDELRRWDWDLRNTYRDLLEGLTRPPRLANSDGEPLEFVTLYYQLHCTVQEAFDALATLSPEPERHLAEARRDAQGRLQAFDLDWLRKEPGRGAGYTVLGNLHVEDDRLTIEVNSRERAESMRRRIARRLGRGRAQFQRWTIESPERQLAERLPQEGPPPPALDDQALQQSPELQAAVREMAERHWRDWLDHPLPALQGQTPRQAAATPAGRERLEGLLLGFERARTGQPFDPDVDWLRRQLGLSAE